MTNRGAEFRALHERAEGHAYSLGRPDGNTRDIPRELNLGELFGET